MDVGQRFWSKVRKGPGCWEWTGYTPDGYGRFSVGGRAGRMVLAHRIAFEMVRGPIPEGLHLDHLCRNRACVNPSHLEPVTQAENNRRAPSHNAAKTECPAGHPYNSRNTKLYRGRRYCRRCKVADQRRRRMVQEVAS